MMNILKYTATGLFLVSLLLIISTFVMYKVTGSFSRSTVKETKILISQVSNALDSFNADCGTYPSQEAGLQVLVIDPQDPSICNDWGPSPYFDASPRNVWVCSEEDYWELEKALEEKSIAIVEAIDFFFSCLDQEEIDESIVNLPRDSWGNPFLYIRLEDEKGFELVSLGKDGEEGGEDFDADISSNDL